MLNSDASNSELNIEIARPEDVISNPGRNAHALVMHPGKYAIMDPETIMCDADWNKWLKVSDVSKGSNFGPGGDLYASRINGYLVSGITAYVESGEYTDEHDQIATTISGVLAAIPIQLLNSINVDYSDEPTIFVEDENRIFYSDDSYFIFFGDESAFYTGYPEDDERIPKYDEDEDI